MRWTPSLLVLAVVGCGGSPDPYAQRDTRWTHHWGSFGTVHLESLDPSPGIHEAQRPRLGIGDDDIERALADHPRQAKLRAERLTRQLAEEVSADAKPRPLAQAVSRVERCYAVGARDVADAVIAQQPRLYRWDQAGQVVEISARFRRTAFRQGQLELTLERKAGVQGPLAVAISPGTYGAPFVGEQVDFKAKKQALPQRRWVHPRDQRRFGHWPPAQDLALLRAPVLSLPANASRVTRLIPVACASFRIGAPRDGQPIMLDRFKPGSKIDKLAVALCAGPRPDDAEAQLAVWLSRDDIGWEEFVRKGIRYGRLMTFSRRAVLARHAPGAGKLLLDAGVDPRGCRLFQ